MSAGAGPEGPPCPSSFLRTERAKLKKASQYVTLIVLASLVCSGGICWAISITATGSWSETIDASDLQAGAGSDLISTYESAADAVIIDITDTSGAWGLDVKKIDTNWHSNLHLHVKRTSDGQGPGSISGGTSYQEVTDTDLSFFSGDRWRSDVDIQLKLTGVSIQVPLDTYTTTVYYTIFDQ